MPEIGLIFEHFGPYHVARCRGAIEHGSANGFNVVPIELFGNCDTYAWEKLPDALNVRREVVFEDADAANTNKREINNRLFSLLDRLKPKVLAVHGWALPGAVSAIKWGARNGVPVIVMSESRFEDAPRSALKEFIKRQIVAHASAALVGAGSHADYLKKLGMPSEAIFRGYNAVDNDYFANGASKAREDEANVRAEYDLPKKYFFASSRFIAKKNLNRLIKAYSKYVDQTTSPWHLVIAGDGPMKDELVQMIGQLNLTGKVHLPGFLQYGDLPKYYGLASAFAHVSTVEQWGLVVNEAAASGLPLIVSSSTGCASELVREGKNGLLCDAHDTDSIVRSLEQISALPIEQLKKYGEESEMIVAGFGPKQFGTGITGAAVHALKHPRRANLLSRLFVSFIGFS